MTTQLQLGLVQLDMGSMSHVLNMPRTQHDYNKYLTYVGYMTVINKVG